MRFITYTFLILVLFVSACENSTEPSSSDDFNVEEETATLNTLYNSLSESMMDGDVEQAGSIVGTDFKLYSSNFPMMTKTSWLNDFFPAFMPGNMVTITTENITWNVASCLAVSTSEDYWEWADPNIPAGMFCATTIYEKDSGSWKIIQIHFTPKIQ